jgi:hypothetical protein
MDPKQYIYHRLETNQKFKITYKITQYSLFQTGCARNTNIFPNHNKSLTLKISYKISTPNFPNCHKPNS